MKKLFLIFVLAISGNIFAQDDLLNQLDAGAPKEKQVEMAAFKGLQIGTMQSTKLPVKGEFYFLVSHRFCDLTQGINNFFGLDGTAYTKLGGIYGITNWLSVGASRHTPSKIYEVGIKYKLANQEIDGFPVTIVGYNTIDINSKLTTDDYPGLKNSNRFAYTTQLPISRKFTESFSMEINSIFVHKNLYEPNDPEIEGKTFEKKDQFVIAAGGRYKVSKRISLNLEYAARAGASDHDYFVNPITFGVDIETGGHVFQMVFSNSQKMNDVSYFTNTVGRANGGGIFFGFNMYRVF